MRPISLKNVPTLVVSAEHDIIAPPHAGRALAAGIDGARYVCIPNTAHGVILQSPELINPLLLKHLSVAEEHCNRRAVVPK